MTAGPSIDPREFLHEHLAEGLIAGRFDHATSRDLDPQLHSHVLVSTLAS